MDALVGSYVHEVSESQLRYLVPSVFAVEPYERMTERYLFFPTYDIVKELNNQGFVCVSAVQGRTRIPGKEDFTKHMLKFQHASMNNITKEMRKVGNVYPQVILTNSHDGTSAYKVDMGLFRLVCHNGMMVSSRDINSIRVRHSGKQETIGEVIEASYRIIDEAPKVLESANRWNGLMLPPPMQQVYATTAMELRESDLVVTPEQLLRPKRWNDGPSQGDRSLWNTFNVVQENLIKGGLKGTSETGRRIRTREIKNIDKNTKLNKALWKLAESMADMMQ